MISKQSNFWNLVNILPFMVLFVISSVSAPLLLFDTNYVLFSISFIYCVALVYHVLRSLICAFFTIRKLLSQMNACCTFLTLLKYTKGSSNIFLSCLYPFLVNPIRKSHSFFPRSPLLLSRLEMSPSLQPLHENKHLNENST